MNAGGTDHQPGRDDEPVARAHTDDDDDDGCREQQPAKPAGAFRPFDGVIRWSRRIGVVGHDSSIVVWRPEGQGRRRTASAALIADGRQS
jgi:hypothetical protein